MEKRENYDFIEVVKGEKAVRAIVTGHICNGAKTKILEKEVNGKKLLTCTLRIDGKLGAKFDVANGEYDKSKTYDDPTFVRVTVWDEKKFNLFKTAEIVLLAGNISKSTYQDKEFLSINVGKFDQLKVLKFMHRDNFKSSDFESNQDNVQDSQDNEYDSEMPF